MNEKEKMVLDLIKQDAFLSQQEMAEQLQMSRPALANIISGLIKKGEIIGRAYVLPEKDSIVAIGGANVDRKFYIQGSVQLGTSNPVHLSESVGGVARNIAENLGRLGNTVKLITAVGKDQDAQMIKEESKAFINLDLVEKMENSSSGSYSAVLKDNGELVIAMANMDIYDQLLPNLLQKHEATLFNARCIIVDLNCPKETVIYLKNIASTKNVPLAIIPVSSPKMKNMPEGLDGITYFICNRDEAETYLNIRLDQNSDHSSAVKKMLNQGAQNVILTLGEEGVIVGNHEGIHHYDANKVDNVLDVTGAGDAFVSAFLHGSLNGESIEKSVHFGLYNAAKTLQSDKTVRLDLSAEELQNWRNY